MSCYLLAACGPSAPTEPEKEKPGETSASKAPSTRRKSPPDLLTGPGQGQLPPQFAQGISYQLSPFSPRPRARDGSIEPRAAVPLTDPQRASLKAAMEELKNGPLSKDKAISIIDTFTDAPSLELLPLVNALLQHEDRDVRGQALTLLEGLSDATLLPVVQQGLQDPDPAVRLQAIETTSHLQSPALPALLTASYNDTDPNVRLAAFQTATEQPAEQRQPLITAAVKNPNQDLAQSAIDLLEAEPSKFSIATIMEGLDHKEPFVREKAHDVLALTLGEPFKSSAEAKAWWRENERKYDKDLVRVVD